MTQVPKQRKEEDNMARVLGVLGGARKDGYTATLLNKAIDGATSVKGVQSEVIRPILENPAFKPCTSCFDCIRNPDHMCTLDDDMGRGGAGVLFKKFGEANGFIFADPVHFWGTSAGMHLIVERLYPYLWSGKLFGIPIVTISCATNQGMMNIANRDLCKWAFTLKMKYLGGLPVHAAYFDEALDDAYFLGKKLGEAAAVDEKEGRKAPTDEESWFYYMDKPWNALELYFDNLTRGSFKWEQSLIEYGLRHKTFKRPEAVELLEKARAEFIKAINAYNMKELESAQKHLLAASAFWTHATWSEFLELNVIGAKPPEVYRPVEKK